MLIIVGSLNHAKFSFLGRAYEACITYNAKTRLNFYTGCNPVTLQYILFEDICLHYHLAASYFKSFSIVTLPMIWWRDMLTILTVIPSAPLPIITKHTYTRPNYRKWCFSIFFVKKPNILLQKKNSIENKKKKGKRDCFDCWKVFHLTLGDFLAQLKWTENKTK